MFVILYNSLHTLYGFNENRAIPLDLLGFTLTLECLGIVLFLIEEDLLIELDEWIFVISIPNRYYIRRVQK